jgi:prephenate dehydrogenase
MDSPKTKITIIGVGLMGGSLALALKDKFPDYHIIGYARSKKSYDKLVGLKILDFVERDLGKAVSSADFVVLALPVFSIIACFRQIAGFLKPGAIVFDLGSSRVLIDRAAKKYLPGHVEFVGCHPLCGSEKAGAQFSRKDLYQKMVCLITSENKTAGVKVVQSLWEQLGSKVVFISSSGHDRILSIVSHLPHLVSFSLTALVAEDYLEFIPPSFKSLSRISGSPAQVWADIFLSNKKNILRDSKKFIANAEKLRKLIKTNNRRQLVNFIEQVNAKYSMIEKKS